MATTSERVQQARTPSGRSGNRLVVLVSRVRELGLLAVLLLIVLVVGLQVPQFLTLSNMVQILLSVSILAIVAIGETLVILTRNVDLSVGSVVGFSAFASANLLAQHPGISLILVFLFGCLVGCVMGALNGVLVAYAHIPAIVVTLATLNIYRGLDFAIAGGNEVSAFQVPASFLYLAAARIFSVPLFVIVAAVFALVAGY